MLGRATTSARVRWRVDKRVAQASRPIAPAAAVESGAAKRRGSPPSASASICDHQSSRAGSGTKSSADGRAAASRVVPRSAAAAGFASAMRPVSVSIARKGSATRSMAPATARRLAAHRGAAARRAPSQARSATAKRASSGASASAHARRHPAPAREGAGLEPRVREAGSDVARSTRSPSSAGVASPPWRSAGDGEGAQAAERLGLGKRPPAGRRRPSSRPNAALDLLPPRHEPAGELSLPPHAPSLPRRAELRYRARRGSYAVRCEAPAGRPHDRNDWRRFDLAAPTPEHALLARDAARVRGARGRAAGGRARPRASASTSRSSGAPASSGCSASRCPRSTAARASTRPPPCRSARRSRRSDPGFALSVLAHAILFAQNVNVNGNDEQRERVLPQRARPASGSAACA